MTQQHTSFFGSHGALRRFGVGLFLSSLYALGMSAAQAADFSAGRVGFVNLERVLKESAPAKVSASKLDKEFASRQKDGAAKEAAFKAAVAKFQIDAPVLAEASRLDQQKKLLEQERDLQRLQRSFQEDLIKRRNEEMLKLNVSVNKAVKDIAAAEKLDFVLQSAIFVDPKNDLTDRVLKMLDGN